MMKTGAKLFSTQLERYSDQTTTPGPKVSETDIQIVNTLFEQLAAIFPAWRQAFDGPNGVKAAKRQWMIGLSENEINSTEKLNRGLAMARKSGSAFLPSVGQFVEWCKGGPDNNWESQSHLMLADRTAKAITKEERIAMLDKHQADLHKALRGEL